METIRHEEILYKEKLNAYIVCKIENVMIHRFLGRFVNRQK